MAGERNVKFQSAEERRYTKTGDLEGGRERSKI